MAHPVTCYYCGVKFDRDKEPTVQVSARRYAHKECAEKHSVEKSEEEKDLESLEQYIMKLFDEPFVNARIKKQIKDYQKQYGYTYSGMLKALIWFFEVKGNSTEKANGGIGIIPYVYKDAYNYYYNLYLAQIVNQEKDVGQYQAKVREIVIQSPKAPPKKIRLFDLGED